MRAWMIAALLAARPAAAYKSAWVAPWGPFSSQSWDCFDEINPFSFAFDARMRVLKAHPELLERAAAAKPPGVRLVPTIVNDVFDSGGVKIQTLKSVPLLTYWLTDSRRLEQHAADLAEAARPYDGIEIDYERMPDYLWGNFAVLLSRLGEKLHRSGKVLGVDLESGPLYRKGGASARAHWPALARACDKVKVMCYYERGAFAREVGPGASFAWVEETARRAAAVLPAEKTSLAFSLAATDWEVPLPALQVLRRSKRIHFRQMKALLRETGAEPLWDDVFGSPFFRYGENGRRHEVWYEDERSLGRKIEAARRAGVGVSLWYLGAERPDLKSLGLCRD